MDAAGPRGYRKDAVELVRLLGLSVRPIARELGLPPEAYAVEDPTSLITTAARPRDNPAAMELWKAIRSAGNRIDGTIAAADKGYNEFVDEIMRAEALDRDRVAVGGATVAVFGVGCGLVGVYTVYAMDAVVAALLQAQERNQVPRFEVAAAAGGAGGGGEGEGGGADGRMTFGPTFALARVAARLCYVSAVFAARWRAAIFRAVPLIIPMTHADLTAGVAPRSSRVCQRLLPDTEARIVALYGASLTQFADPLPAPAVACGGMAAAWSLAARLLATPPAAPPAAVLYALLAVVGHKLYAVYGVQAPKLLRALHRHYLPVLRSQAADRSTPPADTATLTRLATSFGFMLCIGSSPAMPSRATDIPLLAAPPHGSELPAAAGLPDFGDGGGGGGGGGGGRY